MPPIELVASFFCEKSSALAAQFDFSVQSGGFAAYLAESLWLSVELSRIQLRLRRGGKASPMTSTHGKPEAFRKERGKAATCLLIIQISIDSFAGQF